MDKSSHPPHIFIGKIPILIEGWYIQNSPYRHVPFDYNNANLTKHAIFLTHLTNVSFDSCKKTA